MNPTGKSKIEYFNGIENVTVYPDFFWTICRPEKTVEEMGEEEAYRMTMALITDYMADLGVIPLYTACDYCIDQIRKLGVSVDFVVGEAARYYQVGVEDLRKEVVESLKAWA